MPAPTVTPQTPGRDEGRVRAAAIPEDAKWDKHFCDPQQQTSHDALVRSTCTYLIASSPGPFWGHSGRFFLWHWMQVARHSFLGALQPSTHSFLRAEPRAGRSGWTISLSAVWPWTCLSHGTWEVFPRKHVLSVPVDESSMGEEPGDKRSLPSNKVATGMCT